MLSLASADSRSSFARCDRLRIVLLRSDRLRRLFLAHLAGENALEQLAQVVLGVHPADHIEDSIAERLLDPLELVEQRFQHVSLARLAGDQVEDVHLSLLADAVNPAHALFEPMW